MKSVKSAARSVKGRLYEVGLRAGLTKFRKPWDYSQNVDYWNRGYASGQHDHYASLSDCPRYGVLAGYLAAKPGPLRILDIGCGQGLLRERIPDQKVSAYLGLDQSASAIEIASKRSRPNTSFEVARLPGSGDWDVAICNEMLYYVDDIQAFLRDVRNCLSPDGLVLVSMTRFHGDFVIRDALLKHFTQRDECVVTNEARHEKWRLACYSSAAKEN